MSYQNFPVFPESLIQGKGREGKGREGKGREGKGREGYVSNLDQHNMTFDSRQQCSIINI
jgi:hypothetical protein